MIGHLKLLLFFSDFFIFCRWNFTILKLGLTIMSVLSKRLAWSKQLKILHLWWFLLLHWLAMTMLKSTQIRICQTIILFIAMQIKWIYFHVYLESLGTYKRRFKSELLLSIDHYYWRSLSLCSNFHLLTLFDNIIVQLL